MSAGPGERKFWGVRLKVDGRFTKKEERMQRHFSNRGEALAEVAAGKTMTHRMPPTKAGLPSQRGRDVTTGQWKPRGPEEIRALTVRKRGS